MEIDAVGILGNRFYQSGIVELVCNSKQSVMLI